MHSHISGKHDGSRPVVLLFMGPSRTSKTAAAKQIAQARNGRSVDVHLNMGQYSSPHEKARLNGSPSGYSGSSDGALAGLGNISRPVVLLDEIGQAHPEILSFFLSVFDEGQFQTGALKTVNCKSAIFIMTTNCGSDIISSNVDELRAASMDSPVHAEFVKEHLRPALQQDGWERPMINRITRIVPFLPFTTKGHLEKLVRHHLEVRRTCIMALCSSLGVNKLLLWPLHTYLITYTSAGSRSSLEVCPG